jgi:AcrR family transcriptional regulator
LNAKVYSMSRGDPETRSRILAAARALMDEAPGGPVSMGAVAARAGVSRQALYLHFADRTTLFVEVSRLVDDTERTADRQRRVDQAPTGRDALRAAVALQGVLKPRVNGLAATMDVMRRADPAAKAAWQEREYARLGRCEDVVRRLGAEGSLAQEWEVPTAARLMWAVTSQRVWDDLVRDQGWSQARYVAHLTTLLERALLNQ